MNALNKWILYSLSILMILFSLLGGYFLRKVALIGTAYKAKVLCSGIFVSKRDPESILNQDLGADDLALLKCFHAEIDYDEQSVSATFLGMAKRKAIFREGLGCTLVIDFSEEQIRSQSNPHTQLISPSVSQDQLWPMGERVLIEKLPPEINPALLRNAIDTAFSEPDPNRLGRTRAVVVVYDGRIIAERYAQGFSQETPLIGWSVTKSIMNALIGILVGQGKLSLEDNSLLPEWCKSNDPRSDITLDQLLRMISGLKFNEDYTNPLEDVIFMLLGTGDAAAYAAHKPLETTKPGIRWYYSSGTTNILSRIMRGALGGKDADYLAFPRRYLFDCIGMHSAIIEPDAAGTFIGSSFMYATARDWARFGLLYLQDGIWEGKRILPEGWVEYTFKPTPQAILGEYGSHFWLKVPSPYKSSESKKRDLPSDTYLAAGHEGQFITIIPSRKIVIVRLGLSRLPGAWDHESFITRILEAIPD